MNSQSDCSDGELRFPRADTCRSVIIDGLTAILFMIGYAFFGVAMIRTATLPRCSGVLVALGAPAHLLSFGIAQVVSTAALAFAILEQCESWRRPGLALLLAVAR